MSFDSLGLSAELLRAISEQGYSKATPVQSKAIPIILSGRDVLVGAQTGTGKTAGFTLPMLQLLSRRTAPEKVKARRPVRALVLTPTRELAAQVGESIETYGRHLALRSSIIFGGVKINPQITRLRQGVDILVATPGRLLDHAGQKTVDLSQVEILVLDEADRMLDMGFIHDIRKVLALMPKNEDRQTLLFSATFSSEIKRLAGSFLSHPELIEVERKNTAAELIRQVVYPVDKSRKRELLSFLIGSNNWQQVLVFTRTKHGANRLARQLEKDGLSAVAIHGNKSQGARTRALADFKAGDVRILVATDIAARGLDIDQLPHVVNYELPNVAEDYVHRIGRTGRAGREGEAMSLVCVDELKLLRDIERLLNREIPKVVMEGYEPDLSIKPEPIQKGRQRNRQQKGRQGKQQNSWQGSRQNTHQSGRQDRRSGGQSPTRNAKHKAAGQSRRANSGRHKGGVIDGNTMDTENTNGYVMSGAGSVIGNKVSGCSLNRSDSDNGGRNGGKGRGRPASREQGGGQNGSANRRRNRNGGRRGTRTGRQGGNARSGQQRGGNCAGMSLRSSPSTEVNGNIL